MSRGAWVAVLVCLGLVVAGVSTWSLTRDSAEAQVRAAVESSLAGGGAVELGPLMRDQDASALVVVCPYMPASTVEADTGIPVTATSNDMNDASVDLVFASGTEVRTTVTLPTRRYDVCSDLGDYDEVPVFGPDVTLSARGGDALAGDAEVLVSLVQ